MNDQHTMGLSARDKTPKPSGWGVHFEHTTPQRHVSCALGNMLVPRSADDIPPITPEAMASVQAALKLLANLVADRDLGIYMGVSDARLEMNCAEARSILSAARGLVSILRVESPAVDDPNSRP